MEFVGEIRRADGDTEPLYVESDLHYHIIAYFNAHLRSLKDGDSITVNRTK